MLCIPNQYRQTIPDVYMFCERIWRRGFDSQDLVKFEKLAVASSGRNIRWRSFYQHCPSNENFPLNLDNFCVGSHKFVLDENSVLSCSGVKSFFFKTLVLECLESRPHKERFRFEIPQSDQVTTAVKAFWTVYFGFCNETQNLVDRSLNEWTYLAFSRINVYMERNFLFWRMVSNLLAHSHEKLLLSIAQDQVEIQIKSFLLFFIPPELICRKNRLNDWQTEVTVWLWFQLHYKTQINLKVHLFHQV